METVFTVSDLTAAIKEQLEAGFSYIRLEGESLNFSPASSGHWYFTLKDENAVIQAVMFQNRSRILGFVPSNGMKILVSGSVSVYAKRGNYQIICEHMEHAGQGRILLMLEERKRRLSAEGLFDSERKKSLPLFPKRVALVTSPTGAAVRDILQVLSRRAPGIDVIVFPAAVQGAGAAEELTRQLRYADRLGLCDVIIVGRGGGSLEDLLPFSEEVLVRAIAECETPVISAVGHEIDSSLSDFAADLRAPTPSAAAELVAGSHSELVRRVMNAGGSIVQTWLARHRTVTSTLRSFDASELALRFRNILQISIQRIDDARDLLQHSIRLAIERYGNKLLTRKTELEALSPYAVLTRGYAIVKNTENGQVIGRGEGLADKTLVTIKWADMEHEARISVKKD